MTNSEPIADISAAFNGKIKRPSVSPFYTLGLLLVTVVMAILPLIYIALVATVIYATYYHTVHNFGPIMNTGHGIGRGGGRIMILKFFIYATPIFMGSILSFFMVKPLLARRIDNHQPYALNPEAEPLLYDFIRKICEQVGAPMPAIIELDSGINAAASLRRGFKSFFANDLSLHIGLSLMAGLTMREFAGVIAHEFGHFTQGLAMRLNYIIARIDGWFARLIYERDSWDAMLEEMAHESEGYITFMVMLAQLGVWFSRKVLFILMLVGHAFSCFLSRQMEFHADQYEIRLAGSQAFESTSNRLRELNALAEAAFKEIRVTWNLSKRIPDNFPQFMLNKAKTELGGKIQEALKKDIGFVKTGLFHTHPSDADRVRAARLAQTPGIFTLDRPATDLFANFAVPARIVTQLYYQEIELPLAAAKIFEVEPIPTSGGTSPTSSPAPSTAEAARAAVDRFLFGVVTPLRPIFPKINPIPNETEAFNFIQGLPEQINQIAEPVATACTDFDQADESLLTGADPAARETRDQARRSLRPVLEACESRLSQALSLSRNPEAQQKCHQLQTLAPALKEADQIRPLIAQHLAAPEDRPGIGRLEEGIANLEAALRDVPCPWPEGNGSNLYDFFRAVIEGPVPIAQWGQSLADCTMTAYMRILGDLALIAEQTIEQGPQKRPMRVTAQAQTA